MIDKKSFEQLDNSAVKLTVSVNSEGTSDAYNSLIAKYAKQIQIPGFRKGKVPRDVIIRKFGDGIRHEAAAELVEKTLQTVLSEAEQSPISQPLMDTVPEMTPGENYEFTVTYDVFPEITLPEYKGLAIEAPQAKILKKDENEELERIREQNSVVIDKQDSKVAKNDIVTMNYVELDAEGTPLEETRRNGFAFTVGASSHPYMVEEDIIGMKTGETRIIEKTYEGNVPPAATSASIRLEVSIEAVKIRDLPALDDELAQDVSDDLHTLDDLRAKIKKDLEKRAEDKIRALSINAITDKLVEGAEIAVPESMIKSDLEQTWADYVRQSGAPEDALIKALENTGKSRDEILNEWRDDATKSIKTRLIYGRIVENEKIEASDEEVSAELDRRAEEFKMPAEDLEKMFGGPRFRGYLKSEIAQKKLFDFLLENAIITRGAKKDFKELMEA